jgi:hypothetical protein
MISFLRRYRHPIIIGLVVVFLISIFVGLGGYYLTGRDNSEAVAVVDGTKIPYLSFRTRVDQYVEALRSQGKDVSDEMEKAVRQEVLQSLIVDEILAKQAESLGLSVSDRELALSIEQTPAFQQDGRFAQELYFRAVRFQFKTTPERFEADRRRMLLAAHLKALITRTTKILPSELRDEWQRRNGDKAKDFEKEKAAFAGELRRLRAIDSLNFLLRQVASQADIRSFLEQREQGR